MAKILSERIRCLDDQKRCDLADRFAHDGTLFRMVQYIESQHENEGREHEGCGACQLIIHIENHYGDVTI